MKVIDQFHGALNQGLAADIFNNLRNLVTCTLILAAAMAAPQLMPHIRPSSFDSRRDVSMASSSSTCRSDGFKRRCPDKTGP